MAYFIESLCPVLKVLGKENRPVPYDKKRSYHTSVKNDLLLSSNYSFLKKNPEVKPKFIQNDNRQMSTGIFSGKQIVLDLSFSEEQNLKTKLRKCILEKGGQISYVVTRDSDLLVCGEKEISKAKFKAANAHNVPILTSNYIEECLLENKILPYEPYLYEQKVKAQAFQQGKIASFCMPAPSTNVNVHINLVPITRYILESYEIIKYATLKGMPRNASGKKDDAYYFANIEVHMNKSKLSNEMFCVFLHEGEIHDGEIKSVVSVLGQFVATSKEALSLYGSLYHKLTGPPKLLKVVRKYLHLDIGSFGFQELQKKVLLSLENIDPSVLSLIKMSWEEVQAFLQKYLDTPIEFYAEWKVREVQNILIQLALALSKGKTNLAIRLNKELSNLLCFKSEHSQAIITTSGILEKVQICNLLFNVSYLADSSPDISDQVINLYASVNCQISLLAPESKKYKEVEDHILNAQTCDVGLVIKNIYCVRRNLESANFDNSLSNEKILFHGTQPSNLLNILRDGLRPPISTLMTMYGLENPEELLLGYGIYFNDSVSACLRFCKVNNKGSMILLVSRVALGKVYKTHSMEPSFSSPPKGFDSVLGAKSNSAQQSIFKENEYVIYKESQQELKYIVEFSLANADFSKVQPNKDMVSSRISFDAGRKKHGQVSYNIDNVPEETVKKSLTSCGLKSVNGSVHDSGFPLENTHIRARVVDLVAKVTVYQTYINKEKSSTEVKYTFPLTGGAAVCGFEAFIGRKHVVGEVKEKETAHKEYKEAVSAGHGAYLLDEEKPDVFTASLGNVPAETKVIIKITYIVELCVESDTLKLSIPTFASKQTDAMLKKRAFSFEACIEMATNIQTVSSPTHKIVLKKTDTKAVLKLSNDCKWGNELEILIRMCEVHMPRMWIEKHPEKGSEVCMVSYYPEFEDQPNSLNTEIVILLDASNSMSGESFQTALTLAVLCLNSFNRNVKFNVLAFGTIFVELFPESQSFSEKTKSQAMDFLGSILPEMGSGQLAPPLVSCNVFHKFTQANVFLISNGYFENEPQLQSYIAKLDNVRLFTLAVSEKTNRQFLKKAARFSGGSYEEYLPREKGKWVKKIKDQVLKCSQLSLTNIEIEWQLFDQDEVQLVVAPQKIKSLFSGSFLISYGFVRNCTVATLKAKIGSSRFETVVSSHKLNELSGTLLHSLAAKACIDDWEKGVLDDENCLQTAKKEETKESIITIAKEYNLVSSLTSFIAVEKRKDGEAITDEPCMDDLLKESDVDILPYIGYQVNEIGLLDSAYECSEEIMRDGEDIQIEKEHHMVFDSLPLKKKKMKGSGVIQEPVNLVQRDPRLNRNRSNVSFLSRALPDSVPNPMPIRAGILSDIAHHSLRDKHHVETESHRRSRHANRAELAAPLNKRYTSVSNDESNIRIGFSSLNDFASPVAPSGLFGASPLAASSPGAPSSLFGASPLAAPGSGAPPVLFGASPLAAPSPAAPSVFLSAKSLAAPPAACPTAPSSSFVASYLAASPVSFGASSLAAPESLGASYSLLSASDSSNQNQEVPSAELRFDGGKAKPPLFRAPSSRPRQFGGGPSQMAFGGGIPDNIISEPLCESATFAVDSNQTRFCGSAMRGRGGLSVKFGFRNKSDNHRPSPDSFLPEKATPSTAQDLEISFEKVSGAEISSPLETESFKGVWKSNARQKRIIAASDYEQNEATCFYHKVQPPPSHLRSCDLLDYEEEEAEDKERLMSCSLNSDKEDSDSDGQSSSESDDSSSCDQSDNSERSRECKLQQFESHSRRNMLLSKSLQLSSSGIEDDFMGYGFTTDMCYESGGDEFCILEDKYPLQLLTAVLLHKASESTFNENIQKMTDHFINDVLAHLGGGLPLCTLLLKYLTFEAQNTQTVAAVLNALDTTSVLQELQEEEELNESEVDQLLLEQRVSFFESLNQSGLKSMGDMISKNIFDLVDLLYGVYVYLYKYLIPKSLSEEVIELGFGQQDIVAKKMVTHLIHLLESDQSKEVNVLIACLKKVSEIDKRYPLIYYSLGLSSSWEVIVFNEIR